jgi:hypothetical protein
MFHNLLQWETVWYRAETWYAGVPHSDTTPCKNTEDYTLKAAHAHSVASISANFGRQTFMIYVKTTVLFSDRTPAERRNDVIKISGRQFRYNPHGVFCPLSYSRHDTRTGIDRLSCNCNNMNIAHLHPCDFKSRCTSVVRLCCTVGMLLFKLTNNSCVWNWYKSIYFSKSY